MAEPAVELPVMTSGKTLADYGWWNATPESVWSPGAGDPANPDDIWARCWAYIRKRDLSATDCRIVWDIAYAAIEAMARIPEADRAGGGGI